MHKKILSFIYPVLLMLGVNFIYFSPALSGDVLQQDDIMMGHAKGKEIRDYRENTGEEPLWTNSMFSGMPAFQISTKYPGNVLGYVQSALSFIGGKSSSIYLIFLLMLGMYLLLIAEGVNPWLAGIGGIAFGFSAFFIISYGAGHNAKVRAAAYIAPTLMGILMTLRGKRLSGFALTALFVGLSVHANHLQITYYQFLLILVLMITEAVFAFRERRIKPFVLSGLLLIAAAGIGIGPNFGNLWSTYTYTKETMRGGSSELSAKKESKGGLQFDYAMMWSYSGAEHLNLIIPMYTGGGLAEDYSGTQTYSTLESLFKRQRMGAAQAAEQANQYSGSIFYWGEESLVNGGYYVGASIFMLFILSLLVLDKRTRAWIVAAMVLSIVLAMGRHMESINRLLFDHLPIYNKFRVPSMTLVIVFVLLPFAGILGLQRWMDGSLDAAQKKKILLRAGYICGGIFIFFGFISPAFLSFEGMRDAQLAQQGFDIDQLIADRKSVLTKSAARSIGFAALTWGILWFFQKGQLKLQQMIPILGLVVVGDLWLFDQSHVNKDDFLSAKQFDQNYAASAADQQILQDPDIHYRVFNSTVSPTSDSYTSYHHKSVGGYHGAKLIKYQDLIENQIAKNNIQVLNMLNTKYILGDRNGQEVAQRNAGALGNAWFVRDIEWVPDADAEMQALNADVFTPATEAVVDARYKGYLNAIGNQTQGANIQLTSYDPKKMTYTASNPSGADLLAVFSEIYYEGVDHDWKVYLNGNEVPHIRVNYLLRGMRIPPGTHEIIFRFEPKTYMIGEQVNKAFSGLLVLSLLAAGFMAYRQRSTETGITTDEQ